MRRRSRLLAGAPPWWSPRGWRRPGVRGDAGAHGLGSVEREGQGRSWGGEASSTPQVGGGDDSEGAPPKGAGAVSMTTALPFGRGRGAEWPEAGSCEDRVLRHRTGEVLRRAVGEGDWGC